MEFARQSPPPYLSPSQERWLQRVKDELVAALSDQSGSRNGLNKGLFTPRTTSQDIVNVLDKVALDCLQREEKALTHTTRDSSMEAQVLHPAEAASQSLERLSEELHPLDENNIIDIYSDEDSSSDSDADGYPPTLDRLERVVKRFGKEDDKKAWYTLRDHLWRQRAYIAKRKALLLSLLARRQAFAIRQRTLEEREELFKKRIVQAEEKEVDLSKREISVATQEVEITRSKEMLSRREAHDDAESARLGRVRVSLTQQEKVLSEKESALQQQAQSISRRKEELDEKETALVDERALFDATKARPEELKKLEEDLSRRTLEIDVLETKLASEKASVERIEKGLQEKDTALCARDQKLAKREMELVSERDVFEQESSNREAELMKWKDKLSLESSELAARRDFMDKAARSASAGCSARETAVYQLEVSLKKKGEHMKTMEQTLVQRIQDCDQKEEKVRRCEVDLEAKSKDLQRQNDGLVDREREIARKATDYEAKLQICDSKIEDCNRKRGEVDRIMADLAEQKAQLEAWKANLEKKDADLEVIVTELEGIRKKNDVREERLAERAQHLQDVVQNNESVKVALEHWKHNLSAMHQYQAQETKHLLDLREDVVKRVKQQEEHLQARENAVFQREGALKEREHAQQNYFGSTSQLRAPTYSWTPPSSNNPFLPSHNSPFSWASGPSSDSFSPNTEPTSSPKTMNPFVRSPSTGNPFSPAASFTGESKSAEIVLPTIETSDHEHEPDIAVASRVKTALQIQEASISNSMIGRPNTVDVSTLRHSRALILGGNFFNVGGNASETRLDSHSTSSGAPPRPSAWT